MSQGRGYRVKPCSAEFEPKANWEDPVWQDVEEGVVDCFPWGDSGFRPVTRFKLLYSPRAVHVIFRVQDQFIRCVAQRYGGPVWRDACVEFFFSPGSGTDAGYFNVETNCGGTSLMAYQKGRRIETHLIDGREVRRLSIAHTMPDVVDPEVQEPTVWVLEYVLPLNLLASHASVLHPGPGAEWRANFYKCAETNSHPHWGCWAPIETPKPDFHRPEFFGVLEFE